MASSSNTDIFGLTKKSKAASAISHPSMVGLELPNGNGRVMLCQSVQIDYQRQTQPIYELGSEDVYMAVQGATGTVQLTRAIHGVTGSGSALAPYSGSGCADMGATLKINTSTDGSNKCHAEVGTITCEGATLSRIGFQAQAGNAIITDSAEYVVGAVKVEGGSGGGSGSSGGGGSNGMQGDMSITDSLPGAGGTPAGQGGVYGNPSIH